MNKYKLPKGYKFIIDYEECNQDVKMCRVAIVNKKYNCYELSFTIDFFNSKSLAKKAIKYFKQTNDICGICGDTYTMDKLVSIVDCIVFNSIDIEFNSVRIIRNVLNSLGYKTGTCIKGSSSYPIKNTTYFSNNSVWEIWGYVPDNSVLDNINNMKDWRGY